MTAHDIAKDALQELHDITAAGALMREAQVQYFKTRTTQALIRSKEAERRFDLHIEAAMHLYVHHHDTLSAQEQ